MNDPLEIPLSVETPLYLFRVTLDGREYVIRLDWNGREKRWYLDIGISESSWIRRGIKLVPNWPLLHRVSNKNKPPGHLFAIDLGTPSGDAPEFSDLGQRVKLFYFPAKAL
jgi:hypothetical protein